MATDITTLTVSEHDIAPKTDLWPQILDDIVVSRQIYPGGYYAASGTLSNGDVIEMWIAEERWSGCLSTVQRVYVAINGWCNRRPYGLDGKTAEMADWLRGHHFASPRKVEGPAIGSALELLTVLYDDYAKMIAAKS